VSRYLVEGITPAAGTVCEQDVVPFTQPSAAVAASSPRARVNGVLVPDAVRKSVQ
jgi:hypothetical protein